MKHKEYFHPMYMDVWSRTSYETSYCMRFHLVIFITHERHLQDGTEGLLDRYKGIVMVHTLSLTLPLLHGRPLQFML